MIEAVCRGCWEMIEVVCRGCWEMIEVVCRVLFRDDNEFFY